MRGQLLRRVMIGLTVVGLADATYLTYIHYAGIKPACTAGQSCEIVQTSAWSAVAGVPVALLGLIGYVLILASLLVRDRDESRLATLALTLMGFGFSGYLTYREFHSIHHVCEWCMGSAIILTLLFIGSLIRYIAGDPAAPAEDEPPLATPEMATLPAHGQ